MYSEFASALDLLSASGNLRTLPECDAPHNLLDLSSNDYLGLAERTDLAQKFMERMVDTPSPLTSSASRLLAGKQKDYNRLEQRLAELYGRSALLFNSGYHANTGLISALASQPSTLIVADKLVHASIIDGITLSRAPFKRFIHNDFNRLEKILKDNYSQYRQIIVVVESVYSMDGDSTDLDALTALKAIYPNIILYVDEAHGIGVCGDKGLGLCRSHPGYENIDIVVGTFGKALASSGAFAVMDETLYRWAVNKARSLIFSTALPPINCAWTLEMLNASLTMDAERRHLSLLASNLATATGGHPSHIQPVVVGNAKATTELSNRLKELGFKVLPIRTPTVPPGTERLRISLSAAISLDELKCFTNLLRTILI